MEHCPEDVNLEEFQKNLEKAVRKLAKCDTTVDITKQDRSYPKSYTTTTIGSTIQAENSDAVEIQEATEKTHKAVVHDLHIWSLNSELRAATVHIVIETCCGEPADESISKYIDLVSILKSEFKKIDVTSLTIQPEFIYPASEKSCQNCDFEEEREDNTTTIHNSDIGRPQKSSSKVSTVCRKKHIRTRTNKPPKDVNFYP